MSHRIHRSSLRRQQTVATESPSTNQKVRKGTSNLRAPYDNQLDFIDERSDSAMSAASSLRHLKAVQPQMVMVSPRQSPRHSRDTVPDTIPVRKLSSRGEQYALNAESPVENFLDRRRVPSPQTTRKMSRSDHRASENKSGDERRVYDRDYNPTVNDEEDFETSSDQEITVIQRSPSRNAIVTDSSKAVMPNHKPVLKSAVNLTTRNSQR